MGNNVEGVLNEILKDYKSIAKKAIEKKTGARGLRAIIEKMMIKIMFGS